MKRQSGARDAIFFPDQHMPSQAWAAAQQNPQKRRSTSWWVQSRSANRNRRSRTSEVRNCKSPSGPSADCVRVCLVRTLDATEFVRPNHAFPVLALTLSPSCTCKGVIGRRRRHLQEPCGAAQIFIHLLLFRDEHVEQGTSLLRSQKTGTMRSAGQGQEGQGADFGRLKV